MYTDINSLNEEGTKRRDVTPQNQSNTLLLSNMEVDMEALKNFTDKILNVLTAMTRF